VNSHPHIGDSGSLAIVHNGVIENFQAIKRRLQSEGYTFQSATDTEVIAHLIDSCLKRQPPVADMAAVDYQPLVTAVQAALAQLQGTYGLAILFRQWPDVLIAARLGSPLIVGVGANEHLWPATLAVGRLHRQDRLSGRPRVGGGYRRQSARNSPRSGSHQPQRSRAGFSGGRCCKGGFAHFMLKEIFEQPESIENALRGRLDRDAATAKFGGFNLTPQQLCAVGRIIMTGCGTSWHAALVGEYQIETMARLPVEVEYASELRYRNPPLDNNTLVFAITQSGETADTLAALREMKRKGCPTLGICNVVGSTIAQESDGGFYLRAGPEIGVASTKAFTSQCTVLAMLALYFGRLRHLGFAAGLTIIDHLQTLPDKVRQALQCNDQVEAIARKYAHCNISFTWAGNSISHRLGGALKLKEISYIHAEGYPAAEMKHGPIALVDEKTPSVFLLPHGQVYDKVMSNLQEIKARGGP